MIEHETFYATVAQVIPVLLLANVVELVSRPQSPSHEASRPASESEISDDELLASVDELVRRAERVAKSTKRWGVLRPFLWLGLVGVNIFAGLALVWSVTVLSGLVPDWAWAREAIVYAILLLGFAFVLGVWRRAMPEYKEALAIPETAQRLLRDTHATRAILRDRLAKKMQPEMGSGLLDADPSPPGAGHQRAGGQPTSGTVQPDSSTDDERSS